MHFLHDDKKQRFFVLLLFCLVACRLYSQPKTLGLLKKYQGNDENGYVLFSPIGSDTTFLINKCGKRIHHWRSQYAPGMAVYLKPDGHLLKAGTYTDTSFGAAGGRGGIIEEFDWDGNLVWRYRLFNDSLCQHHDIRPMPNGNVLVLAWHSISKTSAVAKGRDPRNFGGTDELWGERILELKPLGTDSAEVVWQWDLFDHIIQDYDSSLANYGQVDQNPGLMNINYALDLQTHDWIHANSIDYNKDLDQIVISAHNISELWIIDHSTTTAEAKTHAGGTHNRGGDFLYRWGNPEAYKNGYSTDRKLFRQHNAYWIPNGMKDSGCIMFFNNGWGRDTAYSSVEVIRTPILSNGSYIYNLPYGPQAPAWKYKDSVPTKFYSQIISGAQRLPNGNTLICSGVQGRFFEVTAQKRIVWEYKNPVNNNLIQTDGQTAMNNAVFRAEFYPSSYAAFKNRTLSAGKTIEKSSYPYSCNYETVAPTIKFVYPAKGDTGILLNTPLKIIYSEAVLKRFGSINIYSNGTLYETISLMGDNVKVKKDTVLIYQTKAFPLNARIAVKVPDALFRDSSYNYSKGIDSSLWYFRSIGISAKIAAYTPAHQSLGNKAATVMKLSFNGNVEKRNKGNINLFTNGVITETIPVTSSAVTINAGTVSIRSSQVFPPDVLIIISMDSCFQNENKQVYPDIVYGNWYFRTAKSNSIVSLSPVHGTSGVLKETELSLKLLRPVVKDSLKNIEVYVNGQLFETLSTLDADVLVNANEIRFKTGSPFPENARVGIRFPSNAFTDSMGYSFAGTDTSNWNFNTEKSSDINPLSDVLFKVFPNPAAGVVFVSSQEEMKDVLLINSEGKEIPVEPEFSESRNFVRIQLKEIPSGIYTLLINGRSIRLELVHE